MARTRDFWITYSDDGDPRRPALRERRRRWRWRWPWQWFRHRPRTAAVDTRRRPQGGGRPRLWPLLLLLLLLLLLIPLLAFLLLDDSDDSTETDRTASTGSLDPSAAPFGGTGIPTGAAPGINADIAPGAGGATASVPDLPSLNIRGDSTVMDLGDLSCGAERYVLMSDGEVHMIEDLDDETVDALARSQAPIDTIALGADSDTAALEAIAERTGGTFTTMER